MTRSFTSFSAFYPFYLSEHRNRISRRLHVAGSCGVLALLVVAIVRHDAWWLLATLPVGYGCAWIGHLMFERNRPATFRHPLYSFLGDWRMFLDVLRGRIKL